MNEDTAVDDTETFTHAWTADSGYGPSHRFQILAIPGSLRRQSYNRQLLETAKQVAPVDVDMRIVDLASIPHYNSNVEERGDPEAVTLLKDQIRRADALLIATPEYNASIPGVRKDTIGWTSRPPSSSVLRDKPVAIMSAATGRFGAVRGQRALRQILDHVGASVLSFPEVLVAQAGLLFDGAGELQDEATRERVRALVNETQRVPLNQVAA